MGKKNKVIFIIEKMNKENYHVKTKAKKLTLVELEVMKKHIDRLYEQNVKDLRK